MFALFDKILASQIQMSADPSKVVNHSCSIKIVSGHVEPDFVLQNSRCWQAISMLTHE